MGTRGLTAVISGGTHKVAQYGQWDHYPSGQGVTALRFLSTPENVEALRAKIDRTTFVDEAATDALYAALGIDVSSGYLNMDDSDKFAKAHPQLSRDMGAGILAHIAVTDEDSIALQDSFSFAQDSLFCEYAYVVDLDTNLFEVYVGFQKSPHADGRFVQTSTETSTGKDLSYRTEKYEPVRLLASWPLDSLPDEDGFLTVLTGIERYYATQESSYTPADYDDDEPVEPIPGPVRFAGSIKIEA